MGEVSQTRVNVTVDHTLATRKAAAAPIATMRRPCGVSTGRRGRSVRAGQISTSVIAMATTSGVSA